MPPQPPNTSVTSDDDFLLADPAVCTMFNVSAMTLWRWDHNSELGFPKKIKINGRNYRRLGDLRRFQHSLQVAA